MVLQESGEMYLESILVLIRQGKAVRSIDIVDYMGYSKPSVSRAVGLLKAGQYIDVDDGGYITLTAAGREVAEKIYERHTVLTDFLRRLGVDEASAAEDACRMEHVISDATFQALKRHLASPPITAEQAALRRFLSHKSLPGFAGEAHSPPPAKPETLLFSCCWRCTAPLRRPAARRTSPSAPQCGRRPSP